MGDNIIKIKIDKINDKNKSKYKGITMKIAIINSMICLLFIHFFPSIIDFDSHSITSCSYFEATSWTKLRTLIG